MSKVIYVDRESYEKNGKSFYTYFIKGIVRGKEVRVSVIPPDKGGYTVLDIVFGDKMQAELKINPYEIKNEKGEVIKGNTYSVESVDEDGEIYECKIKPSRPSDKSMLSMLIK